MTAAVGYSHARLIEAEHQAAERCGRDAIVHAIAAGRLLAEAKGKLEHGEWLPFIEAHLTFGARTAQQYMQLYENRDQVQAWLDADTNHDSHLTFTGALKQIQKPAPATSTQDVAAAMRQLASESEPRANQERTESGPQSEPIAAWNDQQNRKRAKANHHLANASAYLAEAAGPLSRDATATMLRHSAIEARHAAAVLDELAFSFEK